LIARAMPKNSFFTITERIFENTYILRKGKRKNFLSLNFLKKAITERIFKNTYILRKGKEKISSSSIFKK
jgi:hypothetical protein